MSILKGNDEILSKGDEPYNATFLGADLELDGSHRREISLYRKNQEVLTVEHGVTLGLLKLIYSSDSKFHGSLQGVRSRATDPTEVASVILSDDRVLDKDEYELIVQENPCHVLNEGLNTRLSSVHVSMMSPPSLQSTSNDQDRKADGYVCDYCHLPFVSKAKFLRHRRIHTEVNPYACAHCKEVFPHHLELRKHREAMHMTNKSFKCNYCPKSFATRAELRGHMWRHTGEKNHKCRICGKTFATKGNLKLHIDKHIGIHKHKCPFCPQRFTSHSSLEAHMAKHTGMKAYKCRYCPKSYAQAGQLTSHERLHTGEKPFVCEVCSKGFRLNSTRLAHEKRHSGVRPHICETCGRSYAMPEHLRRHLITHENKLERVVSCPFCKKSIFAGRNMRKHLMRHSELNLTEFQAKGIASSLKPDRASNKTNEEVKLSSRLPVKTRQSIQCMECNGEVKSMRKLIEHLSEVHYQRQLKPTERKQIRIRHGLQKLNYYLKGNVATSETYKCASCVRSFALRAELDEHIIKDHFTTVIESTDNNLLKFQCWYCTQQFTSPESVVAHMTNQHASLDKLSKRVEMTGENVVTSSGLWTCQHCTDHFKTETEYKSHLISHKVTTELEEQDAAKEVNSFLNPIMLSTICADEEEQKSECVIAKYLRTGEKSPASAANEVSVSATLSPTPNVPDTGTFTKITEKHPAKHKKSRKKKNKHKKKGDAKERCATCGDTLEACKCTSVPFRCWFCNILFSTPEDVVTHMTNQHDNLDNLSKRVELADLKTGEETNGLLKKSDYPIFSAAETLRCPKCPKEMQSREAYELHMMTHEATQANELLKTGAELLERRTCEQTDNLQGDIDMTISRSTANKDFPSASTESGASTEHPGKIVVRYNGGLNMCTHCSRVFCGKKALDVHTMKMHGKEYLQRKPTPKNTSPFTCWFCSENFTSPELVVEHMTAAHENLDTLSKRVEDHTLLTTATTDRQKNKQQTDEQKLAFTLPEKVYISQFATAEAAIAPPTTLSDHQPPPGFKVSYALAYVPVFVPENSEPAKSKHVT